VYRVRSAIKIFDPLGVKIPINFNYDNHFCIPSVIITVILSLKKMDDVTIECTRCHHSKPKAEFVYGKDKLARMCSRCRDMCRKNTQKCRMKRVNSSEIMVSNGVASIPTEDTISCDDFDDEDTLTFDNNTIIYEPKFDKLKLSKRYKFIVTDCETGEMFGVYNDEYLTKLVSKRISQSQSRSQSQSQSQSQTTISPQGNTHTDMPKQVISDVKNNDDRPMTETKKPMTHTELQSTHTENSYSLLSLMSSIFGGK
jgi:hypothetical protein